MKTSDFDYELPPDLIAQQPLPERGQSRMLVLARDADSVAHRHIADIVTCLEPGDLLVVNDTRVFPARILGRRCDTGGQVELLLTHRVAGDDEVWEALMRSGFRPRQGIELSMADDTLMAEILAPLSGGRVQVRLQGNAPLEKILERHGNVPLPPYIKRDDASDGGQALSDRDRYQTLYARRRGAVAAPTAGLHFDAPLLEALRASGVEMATVTLHVGPGTFRPVAVEDPTEHEMHAEWYEVPEETAARIAATQQAGKRVVAVGTTTVRTLETVAREAGAIVASSGWSRLFIRSPFTFRAVDALLTNFHLPRSTLLMLVSAFCDQAGAGGRERVLAAYASAVAARYRFYSYGDCMLIIN